jgi:hypothetical protein
MRKNIDMDQHLREGLIKGLSRRSLLKGGTAAVGAAALTSSFGALSRAQADSPLFTPDYGPLIETKDAYTGYDTSANPVIV